ncbi:hypothetical protein CRG98_044877 [Punica granatum]|uniref:Gag/pol protein n=1 Tax=Punica granatum TaxID=22663 RepID=A0A2I0HSN8_PUNGR|nr:hypothetical protein CRG98_044877 [Punica granatum]
MAEGPHASVIGNLMYVMLCTRLNIAYVVSVTSRYQSNPGVNHWTTVNNILKYLRRTKDMVLIYRGGELRLDGFTNSDFQSDVDDQNSKQETTANSTTEAEYIAASDAEKEAV